MVAYLLTHTAKAFVFIFDTKRLRVSTKECGVQADFTMNNKYFIVTLTNLDEFFRFRSSNNSTIFNKFQLNKYAN